VTARLRPLALGLLVLAPAVAVLALALAGYGGEVALPGLPEIPESTRWGLPVARAVLDASAALSIGLLAVVALAVPPRRGDDPDDLGPVRQLGVRVAAGAAAVWTLAALSVLLLTYADLAAVDPLSPGIVQQVLTFAGQFELGAAYAGTAAVAFVVASVGALATRTTTAGVLALVALIGVVPLALTGHASSSGNHDWAVDAQLFHLSGVTVWVGGLAGLAVLLKLLDKGLASSVARYSTLALVSFVAVAASGVVSAAVRLDGWSQLQTPYGALLLGKVIALVALGAAGWYHRRRLIAALPTSDRPRALFGRLALAEVAVMATAIGLAVALARTSPTDPLAQLEELSAAEAILGYPLPPEPTVLSWLTAWRPSVLWLTVAAIAVGLYLAGLRRMRARGDRWPVGRTVSWLLGWLLFTWATSGAPGLYGKVLFSMHMAEHMALAMAVPILLVLGAPGTLALRTLKARDDGSRGPREWLNRGLHSGYLRFFANPLVASVNLIGSMIIFYYSSLFDSMLQSHLGHLLMTLHFLLAGYLFAWVIAGVDPGPKRPPYPMRLLLLVGVMSFHAFFAIGLMSSTTILGAEWYSALGCDWCPDLVAEQYRGASIGWALGELPTVALALAMAVAWARSDDREARRIDRQADRDGDADLTRYNDYLQSLEDRGAR
jgi:putative copper resistance protein D